jgi:NADH-ubiquinone oxidoreductase chain 2
LFISSIIFGTLVATSANSWFRIWIGLEINLLSFIPLIINTKNLLSSESSLKYFLIQAFASTIFLFSIIIYFIFLNFKIIFIIKYMPFLILSTIILKNGTAPFHFWFPRVIEGLTWYTNLILISWQKIAPLIIISYLIRFNFIIFIIFISIIFGRLGGLNQTSLRKLIAFSSINHLGWIISRIIFNEYLWVTYFLFYIFLRFSIVFLFNNLKLFNLNQVFKLFSNNQLIKLIIFIPLLSLGGLPPFIGFFPKWIIIEILISIKIFILLNFILFLTLITLYFYLRISYSALLFNHVEINWTIKINIFKNNKSTLILGFLSTFSLILINIFYIFL